jgi:hypothetical protein
MAGTTSAGVAAPGPSAGSNVFKVSENDLDNKRPPLAEPPPRISRRSSPDSLARLPACRTLPQPDARPPAALLDELDAGGLRRVRPCRRIARRRRVRIVDQVQQLGPVVSYEGSADDLSKTAR